MSDVTQLLDAMERGEPQAAEELLPLVYQELRRLAAAKMARERAGQTLQPTALVHEAWIRLNGENHGWANRKHFFGAAAQAMQRILVDRARKRMAKKHGGGLQRVDVDQIDIAATADDDQVLAVHESLERLKEEDPVGAELIRLRFFVGVSNVEAAALLDLSERTAKRMWAYARAWMYEDIRREQ